MLKNLIPTILRNWYNIYIHNIIKNINKYKTRLKEFFIMEISLENNSINNNKFSEKQLNHYNNT